MGTLTEEEVLTAERPIGLWDAKTLHLFHGAGYIDVLGQFVKMCLAMYLCSLPFHNICYVSIKHLKNNFKVCPICKTS